jgi:hypothetical protein
MLSNILKMFLNIPKCFSRFLSVLEMFLNVFEYSEMFQNVPKCFEIFMSVQKHSRMFLNEIKQNKTKHDMDI